jgi:cytochrome c oxidase assembly protein subunit 11
MSGVRRDIDPGRYNLQTLGKLALLAVLMFGFGFAMVPLYKKICEVTGINFLTKADRSAQEFARNTQVDTSRTVTVEFDANHHGPWRFRPERRSVEVHPGELVTIGYELINTQSRDMSGQAIPSYAPQVAMQHFRKLECFCFRQQALGANETRRFPVVFVLDPNLPRDVTTITLSYTFFEVGAGVSPQVGAPREARGG